MLFTLYEVNFVRTVYVEMVHSLVAALFSLQSIFKSMGRDVCHTAVRTIASPHNFLNSEGDFLAGSNASLTGTVLILPEINPQNAIKSSVSPARTFHRETHILIVLKVKNTFYLLC